MNTCHIKFVAFIYITCANKTCHHRCRVLRGGGGGAEGARAPREILLRGSALLEILRNFLQSNAVTSNYT